VEGSAAFQGRARRRHARGRGSAFIVHHTDAEREYAYDRDSSFGRLDKALNAAPDKGWVVVDLKHDWMQMFPPAE